MTERELLPGECPEAIVEAERLAYEREPQQALQLYTRIFNAYSQAKKTREAASCASRLAELYEQTGEPAYAKAFHQLAFRDEMTNAKILLRYGDFLFRQREWGEAQRLFRSLLLIAPKELTLSRADIYLRLGNAVRAEGNATKARDLYRRGLESEPTHAALQAAISGAEAIEAPQTTSPKESLMKQASVCPKCKHNHILYIDQISDQIGDMGGHSIAEGVEQQPRRKQSFPWRIARVPGPPEPGFFGSAVEVFAVGLVEAYVCRGCGYTELYTKDPAKIPVDGKYVRELVGPESKDPYR